MSLVYLISGEGKGGIWGNGGFWKGADRGSGCCFRLES